MHLHNSAFFVVVFFILGVLIASFSISFFLITLSTAFLAVLLFFIGHAYGVRVLFWYGGFFACVIAGAGYYVLWNDYHASRVNIPFHREIIFKGVVAREPEHGETQQLVMRLRAPFSGSVLVRAPRYPEFEYGDLLRVQGVIRIPSPESYAKFLEKEGIYGVVYSPSIEFFDAHLGSAFQEFLFKLKARIVYTFQTIFPPTHAAFLSGITLGERAEFSKEFKEAMNRSGTTHLVALSGYNISILVLAMFSLFRYFLSPLITFWFTIFVVIGFVLMTGAEASVIRAAIMGCIILLAERVGRVRSMRNAIAVTAFVMVLANPNVLRFDIGFQLSFVALLGIVYLMPALRRVFNLHPQADSGFFNWRDHLLTTTSAQLAVIPLLLFYFQNFSPSSLVANMLILEAIPLTMFLGFVIGFLGFFALPLATLIGWFTSLFLMYELSIISLFSKIYFPISDISLFGAFLYYLLILVFIYRQYKLPPVQKIF